MTASRTGSKYAFRVYVAGRSSQSLRVVGGIQAILDEVLQGMYALEVIDIQENPQVAEDEGILATPTLCRARPLPATRIIGDLNDRKKVLKILEIR
jgi:circadian clock protein KaiB